MKFAKARDACLTLLVEKMVELTYPFAPVKLLHWMLIAKNIGYNPKSGFASAGMKHKMMHASASTRGAARCMSTFR